MIPDFLKRENNLKEQIKPDRFFEALEAYKEHFGEGVNTETSTFSEDEFVDVLNECVKTDTTLHEMFNIPEGDEIDF